MTDDSITTTPRQVTDWIDEELSNIEIMRDKKSDPYFDKQAEMFKWIRSFIVQHTDPNEIWRKYG